MFHFLLIFIGVSVGFAEPKEASTWPTNKWTVNKDYMANHQKEIKELDDYLFDPKVKTRKTIGSIVILKGQIIYESYGEGFLPNKPYKTWSISKSVTSALIGIAEKEGRIRRSESICKYGFNTKCELTVEHLLHFSSGLSWQEVYEKGQSIDKSDVANMLYRKRGQQDMAAYALNKDLKHAPGSHWNYSTGDSSLLMAVLKNVYKGQYNELPWTKLFNVLGMKNTVWEVDRSGTFVGGSYVHTTLRDMARFGFLYANKGQWENKKLFTDDWFRFTGTPAPAMYDRPDIWKRGIVGGPHWWLNKPLPGGNELPSPEFPEDALAGLGHWEQYLFVVPSLDLVVVRLGNTREEYDSDSGEKSFDPRTFLKLVNQLLGGI